MSQQVETITGTERRRRWGEEDKRRFVAEAFAPGAVAAHVARRHGVAESCLYAWRKRFGVSDDRQGNGSRDTTRPDHPRLIPVMVEPASMAARKALPGATPRLSGHAVVTWPDGTRVEVGPSYPTDALRALIAALRPRR